MTAVYVDTSALLKRVLVEPQSAILTQTMRSHAARRDLLAASSLAWVEVWRSLRRLRSTLPGLDLDELAGQALSGIAELPISEDIIMSARAVGHDLLRSLDAIHLASALAIGADVVLTYDDRLADAARAAGLPVLAPE